MSRLLGYMKLSTPNNEIAEIRSTSFKLVNNKQHHDKLLESLDSEYSDKIVEIQEELNTELNKRYNGKYKFHLCIDEGVGVDALKLKRKQTKVLGMICHQCNDKLSKIKRIIETKISNNKDI